LLGATAQYDAWDTFLREFVVNGVSLDLRNKDLQMISPKLWLQYPNLTAVDLSNNPHINKLPDELGNLVNLKQLRLQGCSLTSIPDSFLGFKELNSLELDSNKLSSLFSPNITRN